MSGRRSIYRTAEGEAEIHAIYDRQLFPGATHYLPARYHAELNERCERFLRETT